MNAIKITTAFATALQTIVAEGKTPWVIVCQDFAVGVYPNRAAAFAAKKSGNAAGSVLKAADVPFEVIDIPKAAPAEIARVSTIESPCFVVWDTADSMPGARRKDVIAICLEKGVAFYTARTQYQLWLNAKAADAAK